MKKIILSLLTVTTLTATATAQISIAPELGLNMANMKYTVPGGGVSNSMKIGALVGANVNIGLTDNLYLQPGLFYKMNGAKLTYGGQKNTFSINSLEVPVNVWYKLGEPGANRFAFGLGLYVAMNLSGTQKWDAYTDPSSGYQEPSGSHTLKFGSSKPDPITGNGGDDLKAMDMGLSVNAAYELANGLFFHARYQFGFSNLDPSGTSGVSVKTSAISVSVGYNFGGHAKKSKAPMKK